MKSGEAFRRFESDAEVLKGISEQYEPTSAEFHALQRAALALAYVMMNRQEEFAAFVEEMNGDLSNEQRKELQDRYGIDG